MGGLFCAVAFTNDFSLNSSGWGDVLCVFAIVLLNGFFPHLTGSRDLLYTIACLLGYELRRGGLTRWFLIHLTSRRLFSSLFARIEVFLAIRYVFLTGIEIFLTRVVLARIVLTGIKILRTVGCVLLACVEIFLAIRIIFLIQIILLDVVIVRRIPFFSVIDLGIAVASSLVLLTFFSRLVIYLRRPRLVIAPAILPGTDGLPSALWILIGLSGILTPIAVPTLALSVVVIVLGYGKICQKKENQTGPQPTRFQTFHLSKLSLKVQRLSCR